jgi:hypothetical protein|tara:strand:+ start:438 stop:1250 length:813 start_codon:yes stop_codon:yes gene_type:complete
MKSPYTDLTPEESRVLKKVAAKGRMGDTELAHITKEEAAMLKRMGGSGTINPYTGQPEYFLGRAIGRLMGAITAPFELIGDVISGESNPLGQFVENISFGAVGSHRLGNDPSKVYNIDTGEMTVDGQPIDTGLPAGTAVNTLGQTTGVNFGGNPGDADYVTPGSQMLLGPAAVGNLRPEGQFTIPDSPQRLPGRRGAAGDARNMPTAANQPVNLFDMVMRADSGTKEQEDEDDAFAVLPFISGSARYGAKMKRMQNRPLSYSRGGKYGND